MGRRWQELQTILETMLKSKNVYYQPPASVRMKYPCFVYSRDNIKTLYANDNPYRKTNRYKITYISRTPDDPIIEEISDLPSCSFDRHYTSDNLHHDVFNLFF